MRKLLITLMVLMLAAPVFSTDFRAQFAYTGTVGNDKVDATQIDNFKVGISKKMFDLGLTGCVYQVAFAKFGERADLTSGGTEVVYFPITPSGNHGLKLDAVKMFFILGANVTEIDEGNADPITYLTGSTGAGLYWDCLSNVALWGSANCEVSEDYFGIDFGVGISIGIE